MNNFRKRPIVDTLSNSFIFLDISKEFKRKIYRNFESLTKSQKKNICYKIVDKESNLKNRSIKLALQSPAKTISFSLVGLHDFKGIFCHPYSVIQHPFPSRFQYYLGKKFRIILKKTKYRQSYDVESINIWYDLPPEQQQWPCASGRIYTAFPDRGVIFFLIFFPPNFENDTFLYFACHFQAV